jgi:hypothetical protein
VDPEENLELRDEIHEFLLPIGFGELFEGFGDDPVDFPSAVLTSDLTSFSARETLFCDAGFDSGVGPEGS